VGVDLYELIKDLLVARICHAIIVYIQIDIYLFIHYRIVYVPGGGGGGGGGGQALGDPIT
jgi:hypothetical protein